MVADHIISYFHKDEPIITSVNFFLKMPMLRFAVIRYSYEDRTFTFIPNESDPRIDSPSQSKSFPTLRACCAYVRGSRNISIKNHLFVNGKTISIAFYEHFGEFLLAVSYSIFHLIYL
jgi:hypothetical protein